MRTYFNARKKYKNLKFRNEFDQNKIIEIQREKIRDTQSHIIIRYVYS